MARAVPRQEKPPSFGGVARTLLQPARDLVGRAHLGALDLARADQVEVVAGVALWNVGGDGGGQAVVEVEVAALVFDVADHVPRR